MTDIIKQAEPVALTDAMIRAWAQTNRVYLREHASCPDIKNGGWIHPFSVTISGDQLRQLLSLAHPQDAEAELLRLRSDLQKQTGRTLHYMTLYSDADAELDRLRQTLHDAIDALEWCAREGRLVSKTQSALVKKWADAYTSILTADQGQDVTQL